MYTAGVEVVFSRTGFAPLAEALARRGVRRVLVLTGPSRRFVEPARAALAGLAPRVFDGARVHVPAEVVGAAAAALGDADAIVALGGGSAIGLGKALRVAREELVFAAVPTTYAGSERTSLYGITRGRDKQTRRDPRVLPDVVHYDIALACELPVQITVQSLCNAYAHVASALSTASLAGADEQAAVAGAADVLAAAAALIEAPRDLEHRERAARGAAACAIAIERGQLGVQHALAHLLGGALGVDHAPLHAILLPHFLAHLRDGAGAEAYARLAAGRDLATDVRALLERAGAPVRLRDLGATEDAVRAALASRPELPAALALAGY